MMIAISEQPRRPSKESGVDCTTVGKYRVSSFIETAAVGGAKTAAAAVVVAATAAGNHGCHVLRLDSKLASAIPDIS